MIKIKINPIYKSISLIKNKKEFVILFILSIGGVFVELLSIAAAIPIVIFLIEQDPIEKFRFLEPIFNYFSISTKEEIILFSLVAVFFVYLIRFFYLIFLNYYKNLFSFILAKNLKQELVDGYLSQNYSYFFNQNSSKFVKNIIVEISHFSGNAVNSIFHIFIDIFVISTVLISLTFYQTSISIVIAIFLSLVGISLNYFSKNRIKNWGNERFRLDTILMKSLLEIFNSIREIKIFDKKENFVNSFIRKYIPLGFLSIKQQTFYVIIRQTYEVVTLLAFCLLVFYLSRNNYSNQEILTIVGIFALSAFRLLPLFSRLLLSIQDLKLYLPSIDHLYEEVNLINKKKIILNSENYSSKNEFLKSFVLENINFSYNKDAKILSNLNLEINKNDIIGVHGKSGSGKSTLVDLIFGLITPDNGTIVVDNKKLKDHEEIFKYNIGYVSQNSYLLDDTVKRNVAFGLKDNEIDDNLVLECLKKSQMQNWLDQTSDKLDTIIGENGKKISGGERQRIGIARTLYFNPNLIVLDEPTSSLDENTAKDFLNVLKSLRDKTIIIISHQKNVLSICNKIYEMKDGTLFLNE